MHALLTEAKAATTQNFLAGEFFFFFYILTMFKQVVIVWETMLLSIWSHPIPLMVTAQRLVLLCCSPIKTLSYLVKEAAFHS